MNLRANLHPSNWGWTSNLIRKGSEKVDGVDPHSSRDRMKLDDVNAALAPFDVRYKALVFSKPRSQIGLEQTRAMARVYQRPDHNRVCIAERGLRHAELTTCRNRICSFLIFETADRPGCRAGSRSYGGFILRSIFCAAMALALTACTAAGSDGNGQDAASEPAPILDLLASGDITACAHPAVLSIFDENSRVSFEEAQKKLSLTRDQYDAVGPDDFSLTDVSTAEANKDIAEVKCEANLHVMGHNLGVVQYAVRPQSSGDGIVASFDATLGQAMALAKSDHMSALESAAPRPRKQRAAVVRDEPSDPADPSPVIEEPPVSAYDKASAALIEAADTGN